MIQPSCVSLTELDLCHQPAFPNIFYHTMQSYVLQVFELVATTAAERRLRTARPRQGSNMRKKRRYPSDISSFSHLIESTRRRRMSGGRSPATTGVGNVDIRTVRARQGSNIQKRGCRTNVRQLISYSQHKTPSFEKPGVRGIISLCD